MNTLGKVMAFLVVVAAITASVFLAKVVNVRNSWTAKNLASKNKYADMEPKIEALEARIDSIRNEIFRSRELWGVYIPDVQTNVINPAEGIVNINVGSKVGIRQNMLLHGFELVADNAAVYRGSFLVVDAQPDSSTLKANFRITPDDVKTWKQQGVWRWRNEIPPGYLETFDRQLLAILKGEETLTARAALLRDQNTLLNDAKTGLKQREAELVGGEGLSKSENVEPEYREGLVAAAEVMEEDRNGILLKVDELRRIVRGLQADIDRLKTENEELTEKLPTSEPKTIPYGVPSAAVSQKK